MNYLKNFILVSCVHVLVLSGLAAMTGDGKKALLGSGAGKSGKPDYGSTGHSAHDTVVDGKGAKSTAGGSDAHAGGEGKGPAEVTPATFFQHIRAGNLEDVRQFLAHNPSLSQCELVVASGVKSALWYAFEWALLAETGIDATKALQILKLIFDALKQYAPAAELGEKILENAPTWCCCGAAAHLGSMLHDAVAQDEPGVASFLVDNKIVDVNHPSNHGHPPLAFAKSARMASALIDRGADVNHRTPDGIHVLDLIKNPEVQRAVAAARSVAGYVERDCTCCAPCVLECESCGCAPKICDLFWWLRSC